MFSKIIFNYRKTKQENNKELLEDIEKKQHTNKKNVLIGNILKDKLNTNKIQNVREIINNAQLANNALKKTVSAPSIMPFNINRITEKGIKIINNVYQSKYDFGRSNCTGLGDFIRGCYFLLEFCDEYKFKPKIIFNNCIMNFLVTKTYNLNLICTVLSEIKVFTNNNFSDYNIENDIILAAKTDSKNIMADFVDYVVDGSVYYGNTFIFCNSFPRNGNISIKNKEYIKNILEPIPEIKVCVKNILDELKLGAKRYIVIHIRAGDEFLKNEQYNAVDFNSAYITKIVNHIKKDISYIEMNGAGAGSTTNHFLLIADNNAIKHILKEHFPYFKILIKPITHFGEGVVLEEEKVKNTLIDFYLLSFAKGILSYSTYKHGSGFSYWCAKTFDVPYCCKYVG
jgi:hypothetical protein